MSSTSTVRSTHTLPSTVGQRIRAQATTRRTDLLVVASFLTVALVLTAGLWIDPDRTAVANNSADQFFFEWVLTYTAHALTHGTNPFFTPLMNAPLGVNIASNTGITLIGILLAPITLLLGAATTFVLTLILNLSMTATAWYWLLTRHTRLSRSAAILASAFCGFAPGMMSHANSHLNFTAQFLIPVLLWRLIRMTRPLRPGVHRTRAAIRDGAILGVIAAAQYSIGAEMLFFTAVGVGIYAIAWSAQRRRLALRIARRVPGRLAIAASIAGGLLAYPIWMQFFGPQAYHGTGFGNIGAAENLLSFGAYPYGSIAGVIGGWGKLTVSIAEENTFFGPALLGLIGWAAVRLCRRDPYAPRRPGLVEARALSVTALAIAVLSLGPHLHIGSWHSTLPLPWAVLGRAPLFNAALPGRLALLLTPIAGYLLAVAFDDFRAARHRMPATISKRQTRFAVTIAVLAFLPIVPIPLQTAPRSMLPRFFTSGAWRAYLPAGRTIVSVPPSTSVSPDAQRWQTATGFAFPIDGGYFLGPGADGRSHVGPVPTPTYTLLKAVSSTGIATSVTVAERAQARIDLRYWNAGLVVLPDPRPGIGDQWSRHYRAIKLVATELFGPGRHIDDVWLWTPPA